jgi:hypothetical protein
MYQIKQKHTTIHNMIQNKIRRILKKDIMEMTSVLCEVVNLLVYVT